MSNSESTLLIVDDSEESRYVHARYLRQAGFTVLEAGSGTEGLALAPQVDLVLLDMRLPDINGLEVCRRLKRGPGTASIPVLQTSASFVSVRDKVTGLEGGADAYLTLPVEPTELVATVSALLRVRRAEARAQRMAEEWRATFDAIGDGICLLDRQGRIVRFSRALAVGVAATEPALAGRPLTEVLKVDDTPGLLRLLEAADGEARDFSAGARWLRLRVHAVTDAQASGRTVCVVSDITRLRGVEDSLRHAEVELAAHANSLEKRVDERTRELHARNTELEAFNYSVSHDLRTPLRSMQNFAAILIEEAGDRLGKEHLDYLRRIEAAASRMDRLTNDLLRYSQLSRAEMTLARIETGALFRRIVEALVLETNAPRAAFVLEEPLADVLGSAPMLEQALVNLLGNAVKFGRREEPLRIRCFTTAEAGLVRIVVEDNGIGIEPRYLQKIFKPFEKLHSPSQYAGTGIGLAIVQRGVERMGGKFGVESEPGRGSRFWIELPAA